MKAVLKLSDELQLLRGEFSPFARRGGYLEPETVQQLRQRLRLLSKLANAMEMELAYFRLMENGRLGREAIEQLSTESLVEMVKDPEGKIIRPDFGRK
ncbi:hypothetical protein N2599_13960 [Rhizobium sullae]|uniref:Uncharacterized protein n=1 Tax=Rhizobium sullae TaxID=50338 RepID=A0ABY5XFA8_RHISU|nr:hypothetical protein [Rhizobium sullae]UWU13249.1 hypothetical protein N2599_13960 [Rhizobium sullae]